MSQIGAKNPKNSTLRSANTMILIGDPGKARTQTPCLIGMEACAGSHHVSRKLIALGHDARLMPAKYVKPFLKGHKNDYRDAEATAEAVQRPTMRFVATKTEEQLDLQALHRCGPPGGGTNRHRERDPGLPA